MGPRTAAEIKVAFRSAKVAALRTANGAEATLNDSAFPSTSMRCERSLPAPVVKPVQAIAYASFRDAYFAAIENGGWGNGMEQPAAQFGMPHIPNVTVGWDSIPRCPAGVP